MTTGSGEPHPAAGIANMIDLAYAQDFTKATSIFNDEIDQRIGAALDQAKIAIADQIFNEPEELEAEAEADEADETEETEAGEVSIEDDTNIESDEEEAEEV